VTNPLILNGNSCRHLPGINYFFIILYNMKRRFIFFIFFLASFSGFTQNEPNIEPVFSDVEDMPQFPGGDDSLHAFIRRNTRFPDELKLNNFKGTAFMNILIGKNGQVKDVKILQGCGSSKLDKEALRLFSIMPVWKPGKDNGQPVNVSLYMPVEFSL
jgi:protein TonB